MGEGGGGEGEGAPSRWFVVVGAAVAVVVFGGVAGVGLGCTRGGTRRSWGGQQGERNQ